MPNWFQYIVIAVAVVVAAWYLFKRLKGSISGKDTLDCPFADQCDGCSCRKPELRDKCGVSSDNAPTDSSHDNS